MKQPYKCFRCNLTKWRAPKKHTPKCPECRKEMVAVSKSTCNACGRELYTEEEDEIGLCKVCTG